MDSGPGAYEARRAAALVLVLDILFVMGVGLVLFAGEGDSPRTGARVEVTQR
jgi:hypothetical protein